MLDASVVITLGTSCSIFYNLVNKTVRFMPDFLVNIIKSPWFIGIILVGYGAYYVYTKLLPNAKKVKLAISGFRFNKKSNLTDEQKRKVAISAVAADRNAGYLDSLTLDIEDPKGGLSQGYGIDTKKTAQEELERLLSAQYASVMPIVWGGLNLKEREKRLDFLHEAAGNNRGYYDYLLHQTESLEKVYPALQKEGIVSDEKEVLKYGLIGWDASRACFVARASYDAGYLTEQEAWGYIDRAYKMAHKAFGSWRAFAMSYAIGVSMAQGGDVDTVKVFVEDMLRKPKSPWVVLGWE